MYTYTMCTVLCTVIYSVYQSRHKHSKMVLQLISNAKFSDYTMDDLLRWACQ